MITVKITDENLADAIEQSAILTGVSVDLMVASVLNEYFITMDEDATLHELEWMYEHGNLY